jgi:hypothetical protein
MDSAFPWWLTVVGWLVTASGTLGGVIWTQHRADARERDRVKDEQLTRRFERRVELYRSLLVNAQGLRRMVVASVHDESHFDELKEALFLFDNAFADTHVLGAEKVVDAADAVRIAAWDVYRANAEDHPVDLEQAAELSDALGSAVGALRLVIRRELGVND